MNKPMLASWLAVGLLVAPSLAFAQQTAFPPPPPPRAFSEFAGTWVRDDLPTNATPSPPVTRGMAADPRSCTTSPACRPVPGFDPSAPPLIPLEPKLVITTTPTRITLTTTPPAPYGPAVYRFDGVPTNVGTGQGTLTLAAGSLLLIRKSTRQWGNYESSTVTTDMLSVSGDVLTIERQYSRIIRPLDGDKVGHIAATNEGDDARVKMVFRRQAAPAQ